jgi:hypothetical protein
MKTSWYRELFFEGEILLSGVPTFVAPNVDVSVRRTILSAGLMTLTSCVRRSARALHATCCSWINKPIRRRVAGRGELGRAVAPAAV